MPTLTTTDRDLMLELAAKPLLVSPYSQHSGQEQLNKLIGYGWVAAVHYRQGGTIYRLTVVGEQVLTGQR